MTAEILRSLHVPGDPLLLPNAWDADSAVLVREAGFPVVATSSVAVAAALGYRDGHAPADEMLAAAARIARVAEVPVTVDAEAGYGLPAAELVERLLTAGAVGCNLEDTDGERRVPLSEQADRIAAIRAAAGDRLVVNARVDSFLSADDEQVALADAIARSHAYLSAGADCVYPIHVTSPRTIKSIVDAVAPAPVNVTYVPGAPTLPEGAALGVARISLGGGLWKTTRTHLADTLKALHAGTPPY